MKHIMMALVITAFACSGVEAQVSCKAKTVTKHSKTAYMAPKKTPIVETEICRTVPYEVCTILPDRKTVSCYKTMDGEDFKPMNDEVTYYGPTGKMPGEVENTGIETIVVKGESRGDYCKRDEANKATICVYNNKSIVRDDNGYYSYR